MRSTTTAVMLSLAALLLVLGGQPSNAAKMIEEVDFLPYFPFFPYGKNFDYVLTDPPNYVFAEGDACLLYTSPSPRDGLLSRMPSSA